MTIEELKAITQKASRGRELIAKIEHLRRIVKVIAGVASVNFQVKDSGNNQEWQNVGLTNEECHDAILFLLKQYESELEAL